MLKDNELIGKYIKYSPEITEEIFDKIIKRLKEANFNIYGLNCDFKGFKEYGNLRLYSDYFFQTCSTPEGTEISYKDIIGEENTLIVGNWYELNIGNKWIFKFNRFEPPNKLGCTKSGTPHDNYNDRTGGYCKGTPEQCKLADMEEVYKLFPEEKPVELQLKDLVEGEIYFYTFKGYCNHISMYSGKCASKYDLSFNHVNGGKPKFGMNTTWNSSATDGTLIKDSLRLATPEEKQWLNVCIAKNKFIEKDYALRGYDINGKALKSKSIPEYVECIKDAYGMTKGTIYKVNSDKYIVGTTIQTHYSTLYVIPSTKEAYEAQFKKEEVKEMKFEVGKWYKYKFRLSDTDDIELFYLRSSKTISGNTIYYDEFINTIGLPHHQKSSASYANQYVTDEEVSLEEIQQYLPEWHPDKIVKEWWEYLKKGDYVVVQKRKDPTKNVNCRRLNHIFKIVRDWDGNINYGEGSATTELDDFRPATPEEIKMYEHAGNPVDVTTYKIPEVMKEEYKVGDWVLTSGYADGWGSSPKAVNNKILRVTKIDLGDDSEYGGIYYFDKERTVGAEIVRKATPEEIYAVGGYPEQKEEPKKDNTEDLLEEAKRRFPIGTKFIACNTQTECIVTTGNFRINDTGGINEFGDDGEYKTTNYAYHCVYSTNGKWAEVIPTPEPSVKKDDLLTDKELLEYANEDYFIKTYRETPIQIVSKPRYLVGVDPYEKKAPELILKDENEPVIFPNIKKERIVEIKIKLVD